MQHSANFGSMKPQPCTSRRTASLKSPSSPAPKRLVVVQGGDNPVMTPRLPDMGVDPYGLLLRQRIVFLGSQVTDFSADAVIAQMLMLDAQDPTKDIKFFINSPGGSVTAGMGIYDTMLLCRADIQTYCFGLAASMGAFLLGAGTRGKRHSMPNSRIMIHQPLGGAEGDTKEIEIQTKEIMFHKANLNRVMAAYTGQRLDVIEADTDRDRYMNPVEAREYGIIDHIIGGANATFDIPEDYRTQIGGPARQFTLDPNAPVPSKKEIEQRDQAKKEAWDAKSPEEKGARGPRFTPTGEPELDRYMIISDEKFEDELIAEEQSTMKVIDPIREQRLRYQFKQIREKRAMQDQLNEEALTRQDEFKRYLDDDDARRALEQQQYEERMLSENSS